MLSERASAKINLTLAVVGRRADGYHLLDSLVAFACDLYDELTLDPGPRLSLRVDGPTAGDAGAADDNLVLKAARALSSVRENVKLGAFHLHKRIPVAAGLGGGSADAAAALRLLARANGIAPDDPALVTAAQMTGADVSTCLASRARVMRGIGDVLGEFCDVAGLEGAARASRRAMRDLCCVRGPRDRQGRFLRRKGGRSAGGSRRVASMDCERKERHAIGCHRYCSCDCRSARHAAFDAGMHRRAHVGIGRDVLWTL